MKKGILIAIVMLAAATSLMAQRSKIFKSEGRVGLTYNGTVVAPPVYDYITDFSDYFYIAGQNGRKGLMDKTGRLLIGVEYDNIQALQPTLFWVQKDKMWGVVDTANNQILSMNFTGFEQLTPYLYLLHSGTFLGLADNFGNLKLFPEYTRIEIFNEKLLILKRGNLLGVANQFGDVLIEPMFASMEIMNNDQFMKVKNAYNNKYGIIDRSGRLIFDYVFDDIQLTRYRYYVYKTTVAGKVGFISYDFTTVVPSVFDRVLFYQPQWGVLALKQNNKCGFITDKGVIIPPAYDNLSLFDANGNAIIEKRGRLMMVTKEGQERKL